MLTTAVRELSLDDADLRVYFDVEQASLDPALHPEAHDFEHFARNTRATTEWRRRLWLATIGGVPAGVVMLAQPLLENRSTVWLVPDVHPDYRRRGVASTLIATAEQHLPDVCEKIVSYGLTPPADRLDDCDLARLAHRHGYTIASVECLSQLPLSPDADATWDALDRPTPGYTLHTYVDGLPAELLESFGALLGLVDVDAPSGDLDWEASPVPPELYTERLERSREGGRVWIETVALDETGAVAGLTRVCVKPAPEAPVMQEETYVHRDHRGHGLGRALKIANYRRLRSEFPDRAHVNTYCSRENHPMQAVNRDLGFALLRYELMLSKTVG